MTLSSFVMRNTFRNKRRSLLTMLSISFSLLVADHDDCPSGARSILTWDRRITAKRVITRDRVSLSFFLPAYYRDKIRSVPGVVAVVPMTYFGNLYKDDRATNAFAQIATDPDEYLKVASDKIVPPDQVLAWQRDRAGAMVDVTLADKYGWKIGDQITLLGTDISGESRADDPRASTHRDPPQNALYFNAKYLEESVDWFKGKAGWYATQVEEPGDVARVSSEIDDMFRNSPQRTKTESQQAFQLSFVASLGNVKAFILGICGAVVFTILLVSGKYHGHVDSQPDARSRCAEDAGLHAPARAVDVCVRGHRFGGSGRSSLGVAGAQPD